MAKFEVTLHEVWDKRFTRTVDAGSAEEAAYERTQGGNMTTKNSWLEIDREGLRKSLAQKDKFFLLTEMVANAWDANVSRVEVTLTRPENGVTRLTVTDDSATGWSRLSDSYTMFAESTRKDDAGKRGRFNAGCKDVLALATEACLTTMSGQMIFNADGTRSVGTTKRERGSEYTASYPTSASSRTCA